MRFREIAASLRANCKAVEPHPAGDRRFGERGELHAAALLPVVQTRGAMSPGGRDRAPPSRVRPTARPTRPEDSGGSGGRRRNGRQVRRKHRPRLDDAETSTPWRRLPLGPESIRARSILPRLANTRDRRGQDHGGSLQFRRAPNTPGSQLFGTRYPRDVDGQPPDGLRHDQRDQLAGRFFLPWWSATPTLNSDLIALPHIDQQQLARRHLALDAQGGGATGLAAA